jgi:hypothetical protein
VFQIATPRLHDWAPTSTHLIGAHCSKIGMPYFLLHDQIAAHPVSIFEQPGPRHIGKLGRLCTLIDIHLRGTPNNLKLFVVKCFRYWKLPPDAVSGGQVWSIV